MSRSQYFSNQFAAIQGSAASCKDDQTGSGNFLKGLKDVLGAVAPAAIEVGKQAAIHHLTRGRGANGSQTKMDTFNNIPGSRDSFGYGNLKGNRSGGSFGNAALQVGNVPSTSHARDLRGSGGGSCGSAKRVSCPTGYRYKR